MSTHSLQGAVNHEVKSCHVQVIVANDNFTVILKWLTHLFNKEAVHKQYETECQLYRMQFTHLFSLPRSAILKSAHTGKGDGID